MKFCPKCGNIMHGEKIKGEVRGVCSVCDYVEEAPVAKDYKLVRKEKPEEGLPPVIEGEVESLPLTTANCPKCGHDKAYWWMVQTRGGDEPMTRFYRCEKCNHTWREYS